MQYTLLGQSTWILDIYYPPLCYFPMLPLCHLCAPHKCRCGAMVDIYGLHPLSCRLSAGRLPRHSALHDIIKRALSFDGFNAVLEPVGLDRGDGKRPDGMTVFPFSRESASFGIVLVSTLSPPQHRL